MTDSVDDTDDNRKQLKYGDDAVYVGQQKDGKPHGYGEMTAKNGDTYKGDWVNGKRHGNGKANLADGDEYDGKWVDDMQHGQGILTWSDGKYKGEFERNMMHGRLCASRCARSSSFSTLMCDWSNDTGML